MRAHAEHGFTLVEVLVAFAILAIMLLGLLEGVRRGLDATLSAERHMHLLAHAENRLSMVGTVLPLVPGIENGREDDHEWTVEIEDSLPQGLLSPEATGREIAFYAVSVTVLDSEQRSERLITLRTGNIVQ